MEDKKLKITDMENKEISKDMPLPLKEGASFQSTIDWFLKEYSDVMEALS